MVRKRKWFQAGPALGWQKDMPQAQRRRIALRHRGGDPLRAARALQALSNVTRDPETKRKARADALYFFRRHSKQ